MENIRKSYLWITIFSIAMALLETAVVIYLRQIYYPDGFDFPLKLMDRNILVVELIREAATIIMLFAVGVLTGRNKTEKFGMFLYAFAVWDIFYYVFLKIFLRWPANLLTWDILFLIPTTWTGPVLSPIIVSISMIFFGVTISYFTSIDKKISILKHEWVLLVVGSVILIIGFAYDYSSYILKTFSFSELFSLSSQDQILNHAIKYVPVRFPWGIFCLGQSIILIGIAFFSSRNYMLYKKKTPESQVS